ncbi:hypothetical protein [Acidovorax sp. ACV01]|uniref:hypothetical protein n=1 Tax=Acidovorax sp. ACV01 TaxID=2769311 RepID=UPI001CE1CC1C|nr:hypothetical protein [Acidovorax sp. ACV01]
MVQRRWSAMDGCLVFDITINRAPHDDVPSCVSVSCSSGESESQRVTVTRQWPAQPFEFKFSSGCYVSGYLQQKTPVHIDGAPNTAIFADIHYGMRGQADDHHFEGIMAACPMRGPIPPPGPRPPAPTPVVPAPPAPPVDPVEPLPVLHSHPEELFPYVYVRRWPKISAADLLYGFVQYTVASPPFSSFFEDLVAARSQGREAVQSLALQLIDGDPPYQGLFIGHMDCLPGPMSQFASLLAQLPASDDKTREWLAAAHAEVAQLLQRYALTWAYLESGNYAQALDRVWQSYFALIITLGYDAGLLDGLTRTLQLANLIAVALQPGSQGMATVGAASATPVLLQPAPISSAQIASLREATVVLPGQVFPLPSAGAADHSPPVARDGWIEPYAIGDLQMVRQRLLCYQSGEIARIENVMRGERREVTHKRTHRQKDEQKQTLAEMQVLQNDAADERSNLQEESRKTVAEATETHQYNKFTSSYGPPTQATLDGSWTKAVQQGANPGLDDTIRFARDILNKTVNRVSRSVSHTRSSSSMSQTEDAVVSLIDNTAGTQNMRAVFRWVNKVYEACVVNYGQRLMMEFMVCQPAAGFIAQEQALAGQDFAKPLPPLQLGVATFEDIKVDGPRNYAQLGAYYGVLDLEPPPLAERFASATLRNGEEKQIAVPAGYCATRAFVSCIGSSPGLPAPVVLVGQQLVTPGTVSSAVVMRGEDETVPVSVTDYQPGFSPPGDYPLQVNVEISCTPSSRCMDQWRIRTYASIVRGYQERMAAYHSRAQGGGASPAPALSPLAHRQIEQRELKNACLRLLLERLQTLTGMSAHAAWGSPPSQFEVNEPRYLQFFDEVLEWNEMAYSFYASPGMTAVGRVPELGSLAADDDALFANFLQAGQARVLLPVQPAHVMAFLYFYSAGMLWVAPDRLAPVNAGDIALANDLKHAGPRQQNPAHRPGPCWQVVVPTAMQVLDASGVEQGADLPAVGEAAP